MEYIPQILNEAKDVTYQVAKEFFDPLRKHPIKTIVFGSLLLTGIALAYDTNASNSNLEVRNNARLENVVGIN